MKLLERLFEIEEKIVEKYRGSSTMMAALEILKIESNIDGYIGALEENDDLREKILELELENKRLVKIIEETKTIP